MCNGGKIPFTVISPENRGGGGGRNSEQGVTARQYGSIIIQRDAIVPRRHNQGVVPQ